MLFMFEAEMVNGSESRITTKSLVQVTQMSRLWTWVTSAAISGWTCPSSDVLQIYESVMRRVLIKWLD